jgi:alpha-tubulin suppressor-like RCC1 family protein
VTWSVAVFVAVLGACGRVGFDATSVASDGGDAGGDAIDPRCFVQLAAGDDHLCALTGDGALWCWGRNEAGQLGNGTIADAPHAPMRVLSGPYSAVGAGGNHTCALAADRSIQCWGNNGNHQVSVTQVDTGTPETTSLVADDLVISGSHSCAMIGTGAACWGDADGGQLGTGAAPDYAMTPTAIGQTGIHRLFSGEDHLCAVTAVGLRCWGINSAGQLGVDPGTTPTLCQDMANAMVPCGTVPITVSGLPPIEHVAVGRTHTCAVANDATVWCWGNNVTGALGDGSLTTRATPALVPGVRATSVIAGDKFTCALTTDTTVACWGDNGDGELAIGDRIDRPTPTVIGLTGVREITAASAGQLVCARTDDSLYCWGSNVWNVAGETGGADVLTPRLVLSACP